MNKELKNWLDENTEVEVSAGGWSWWWENTINEGVRKVVICPEGDLPCVCLVDKKSGRTIYTDAMDYGWYGFGDGSCIDGNDESILHDVVPADVWQAVREWFGKYDDDPDLDRPELVADKFGLEEEMDDYLEERNGFTPNRDYFVPGDSDELDERAVRFLGIRHDEEMDDPEEGEGDGEEE